jgi:hypothetical protein
VITPPACICFSKLIFLKSICCRYVQTLSFDLNTNDLNYPL